MSAPFHFEGVAPSDLKPPAADAWAWWDAALRGSFGPVADNAPQTGFFRYKRKAADRGLPCAIWHDPEDGGWQCWISGEPFADIVHAWLFSNGHPITEKRYQAVIDGEPWPDELPATEGTPTAGHNSATPEELALDAIRQADEAFRRLAAEWPGGVVSDEEQDAIAKGYDERLSKMRIAAEAARKAEKDESLKLGKAIDAKWNLVKDAATKAEDFISTAATAYRVRRKELADAAAAAEKAARDKAKADSDAAAAKATSQGAPPPPMPMAVAAPRSRGRATGLQKVESVEITDVVALSAWLAAKNPPPTDFLECVKKIADRLLVHGEVPGAKRVTTYKA